MGDKLDLRLLEASEIIRKVLSTHLKDGLQTEFDRLTQVLICQLKDSYRAELVGFRKEELQHFKETFLGDLKDDIQRSNGHCTLAKQDTDGTETERTPLIDCSTKTVPLNSFGGIFDSEHRVGSSMCVIPASRKGIKLAEHNRQLRHIDLSDKATYKELSMSEKRIGWEDEELKDPDDEEENGSFLTVMIQHRLFSIFFGLVVTASALTLALQTDFAARQQDVTFFRMVNLICLALFTIELLLRFAAYGVRGVFRRSDWKWSLFDTVVILLNLIEAGFEYVPVLAGGKFYFSVLRCLRLFRIVRMLRLGRFLEFDSELKVFLITLASSFRSFIGLIMVLFVTTFMFSLYLMQIVTDHWAHNPGSFEEETDIKELYGSVGNTMLLMYQILTDGVEWRSAVQPLVKKVSPFVNILFTIYTLFTVFAVLNVMTGLFLNAAMRTAEDTKKNMMLHLIRQVFLRIDSDHSGAINRAEFEQELQDGHLSIYLKAIDFQEDGARELFSLLDQDKSGEITVAEFVEGCTRLNGSVKALDFAVFQRESRLWRTCLEQQLGEALKTLSSISQRFSKS